MADTPPGSTEDDDVKGNGDEPAPKQDRRKRPEQAAHLVKFQFGPGSGARWAAARRSAAEFRKKNRELADALIEGIRVSLAADILRGKIPSRREMAELLKICAPNGGYLKGDALAAAEASRWSTVIKLLDSPNIDAETKKTLMDKIGAHADEALGEPDDVDTTATDASTEKDDNE